MNETDPIRLPKFLEGEKLPPEYYFPPDPYRNPPECKYDLRALVQYARKNGKKIVDLSNEEVRAFLIE